MSIGIVLALLYGAGVILYFRYKATMRRKAHLATYYDGETGRKFHMEGIRAYDGLRSGGSNAIDQITWDDLQMDGIYKKINRCLSYVGDQILYRRMHEVMKDPKELSKDMTRRQKLMEDLGFRQEIGKLLYRLGPNRQRYNQPAFVMEIGEEILEHIWLYRSMGLTFTLSLVLNLLTLFRFGWLSAVLFFVNLIIYMLGKGRLEGRLEQIGNLIEVINVADRLLRVSDEKDEAMMAASKEMRGIVNRLFFMHMRKQSALTGDMMGVLADYIFGAFLYDFHGYYVATVALKEHKEAYFKLYEYVGDWDVALSMAAYTHDRNDICTPDFSESVKYEMDGLYHPLISDPVANNVILDRHCMITGSNASGKSTYIKALAISVILGQSLGIVFGDRAVFPRTRVMSSMAVRDDVTTGESYYIREIHYLKRMIEAMEDGISILCLIDEILKGTNTKERIAASSAILDYMQDQSCLAIVATHDLLLAKRFEKSYQQLHFSEQMVQGDIHFDYKVKDGVATSSNAIVLLEKVGFPEVIVQEAKAYVMADEEI